MSSADLVRAQYAGLDFNTQLDDLRARIQIKYAATYNDFAVSALGMMLLDSVSFGLDTLSFYLDRRATDTYLATARTRKAVSRLTRQLGYKMRAAVASSVDLSVTIASPGFDVAVPKGFQFEGPDSLIFENAQATTWLSTDSIRTKSLTCYEGETVNETFVSDGTANQVFQLKRVPSEKFVVSGTVVVTVNGSPFQENEFLTFDATDQFEVGYNDDPPTIRFGDSVAGNIPLSAATIAVTYVASRGKNGLVTAHTIQKEQNPLVISFQNITMTVDNALGSVGGDDPEDLDHAKTFAPLVYKSRFVAITRPDYEALSGSFADPLFGRVAVAQAISSRSAEDDGELNTRILNIEHAIDDPLFVSAGAVTVTGTATVSTGGAVTGSQTLFLTDLEVDSWVKFGADTVLRRVTAIVDDLHATVTPAPPVILVYGEIHRYGKALTRARSRLKEINNTLVLANTELTTAAGLVNTLDVALGTSITGLRTQRDLSVSAKLDADSANTHAGDALTNGTYGLNGFATSPTSIGSSLNNTVVYSPKKEGVSVTHTPGVGLLAVTVPTPGAILVTLAAAGSTARLVMEAVNAESTAQTLVQASYTGNGSANVDVAAAAIPTYAPPSTVTNLKSFIAASQDKASSASSTANAIGTGLDTAIATLGTTRQQTAAIGRNVGEGEMLALATFLTDIQSIIGVSGVIAAFDSVVISGDIATDLSDIETSVVSNKTDIQTALDAIFNHVDALLSADCKANLVTVPILAVDKAGFFTAPSNGLIRALQTYLDTRKEVTQTVQVTSGATALQSAVIRARIGVNPSFSESITKTAVETAIDSVLRGRKFGVPLYLSDLHAVVDPLSGVVFANIEIVGPAAKLDTGVNYGFVSDGNLIVNTDEVITKGQVTVTTETVTKA